jgi:hypothetical protein
MDEKPSQLRAKQIEGFRAQHERGLSKLGRNVDAYVTFY